MIEKKREREREKNQMNAKKWRERNLKKHEKEKQEDKLAYPLTPDRSSVETHYNRSRKIRLRIYKSLTTFSKENRSFADIADLSNQVANDAKCAYETSTRWIHQYTSLNGDFYFFQDETRLGWRLQGEK